MSDKPPYFVDDRHALYAGSIIGIAMREGVVAHPVVDDDGNYTDRIWIEGLGVELVVPEPPADWTLDGGAP